MYTGPQHFVLCLLLSHEANYASVLETSGLANFVNERVLLHWVLKYEMRTEAKGEKELRVTLRCRAAKLWKIEPGLCTARSTSDGFRYSTTKTNRNRLAADALHGGGPHL